MEVIWNSNGKSEITPAQVAALRADVLVLTTDANSRAVATAYLDAQPELRVICVAEDGRTGFCYYTTRGTTGGDISETSDFSAMVIEESLAELDVHRLVLAIRGAQRAG